MRLRALAALVLAFFGCSAQNGSGAAPLPGVIKTIELDAGVQIDGIAIGRDGDVWLAATNYGNNPAGVFRVRPHGEVDHIARIESVNRAAVDADGIAWFTIGAGSSGQQPKLLRIDKAGSVHEFALPPEGNFQGITIGSDGAPAFADAASGEVWRIDKAGALAHYTAATTDADEITAAPDGDLWFTETNGNSIGRIHPADGSLKEYVIPTPRAKPLGIAIGSDGFIWFCESGAGKIGRVASDGRMTEFRIATAGSSPDEIAAGHDALWFTEPATSTVGRIARDGRIAEFAVPGGGRPGPIAGAADGSIWFVSNGERQALGLATGRSRLVHFRG